MKLIIPIDSYKGAYSFAEKFSDPKSPNPLQTFISEDDKVTLRIASGVGILRYHVEDAEVDRADLDMDDDGDTVGSSLREGEVMFNMHFKDVKELIALSSDSEVSRTESISFEPLFNQNDVAVEVTAVIHDRGKGEDSDYENDTRRRYSLPAITNKEIKLYNFEIPEEEIKDVPAAPLKSVLDLAVPTITNADNKVALMFRDNFVALKENTTIKLVQNLVKDHLTDVPLVKASAVVFQSLVDLHLSSELSNMTSTGDEDADEQAILDITIPVASTRLSLFIKSDNIEVSLTKVHGYGNMPIEEAVMGAELLSEYRFSSAVYKQALTRAALVTGINTLRVSLSPTELVLNSEDITATVDVLSREGNEPETSFVANPSVLSNGILGHSQEVALQIRKGKGGRLTVVTTTTDTVEGFGPDGMDNLWYTAVSLKSS